MTGPRIPIGGNAPFAAFLFGLADQARETGLDDEINRINKRGRERRAREEPAAPAPKLDTSGWPIIRGVPINPALFKLPGVTPEYMDTVLKAKFAKGREPKSIDTLPTADREVGPASRRSVLAGHNEGGKIQVHPEKAGYLRLGKELMESLNERGTVAHPLGIANPRGAIAHEVGHSLRGGSFEETADSFAMAKARPTLSADRDALVSMAADKHKVPKQLALAVSRIENWRGIPDAISPKGAVGLMQVMPDIHGKSAEELKDPRVNVDTGLKVLRQLYDRHGSWTQALRAYNGALDKPASGDIYVDKVRNSMRLAAGIRTPGGLTTSERRVREALEFYDYVKSKPFFTETERLKAFMDLRRAEEINRRVSNSGDSRAR